MQGGGRGEEEGKEGSCTVDPVAEGQRASARQGPAASPLVPALRLRLRAAVGLGAPLSPAPGPSRSLACCSAPTRSSVTVRTLTYTHPDPHAPFGAGLRPAEPRTRTLSGCRTLRTRPAQRPIPRPADRAAPPTFPDGEDAGSASRVALGGGGGHPEQQQQPQPQREPEPSRQAEDTGARCAGGGTSGRRRRHPAAPERQRQAAETEPAPGRRQNLAPGGGAKADPTHPSP